MNNRETTECEGLLEYLTNDGSDLQHRRFEKHLVSCSVCKEEAALWHEVWDRLVDDVELVEPPSDLKNAVIDPLFEQEIAAQKPIIIPKADKMHRRKRFFQQAMVIAVILLVFLTGWMARDLQENSNDNMASEQLPSTIETLFHLAADRENGMFNDSPRAYGVACLVNSEDADQLVVYIFGSPPTKKGEAYQVWLLNKGQRTSAGTFTVGDSGIGILTLPVTSELPTIDSIGVTLEQGEISTTPQGPRMFSSEEQKEGNV